GPGRPGPRPQGGGRAGDGSPRGGRGRDGGPADGDGGGQRRGCRPQADRRQGPGVEERPGEGGFGPGGTGRGREIGGGGSGRGRPLEGGAGTGAQAGPMS